MRAPKRKSAAEFFAEEASPWSADLILNENGTPKATLANALVPLTKDPAFLGADGRSLIRYNQLSGAPDVCGRLPWDREYIYRSWVGRDDQELMVWLQGHDISVRRDTANMAARLIGERNQWHPVREYLDNCSWDGRARLDSWLAVYCGVKASPFSAMAGERWLVSAVSRVRDPGSRIDGFLVLKGRRDVRQTSPFAVLGGSFYSSQIEALGIKAFKGMLLGKWILEIDGMDNMSRPTDMSSLRDFVSLRSDKLGAFLGHKVAIWPRQCAFCGLCSIMKASPDRHLWLVSHDSLRIDELARDRDQLWAEARTRYGDIPWLLDDELIGAISAAQKELRIPDQWEAILVQRWRELGPISDRGFGVNDLLGLLGLSVQKRDRLAAARLSVTAHEIGWERRMVDGFWRYFPK
jgi:putative DNA primase/helicase